MKDENFFEIEKRSLLYKFAYPLPNHDRQTSLCAFIPRCVYSLFVIWPFLILAMIMLLLSLAVMAFGASLFGRKIDIDGSSDFYPIEKWPKPFGIRAWPFLLILVFIAMTVIYSLQNYLLGLLFNKIFWIVLLVLGFIVTFVLLLAVLTKSKIYMLFKEWIRAKKNKYCPVIYFVNNKS